MVSTEQREISMDLNGKPISFPNENGGRRVSITQAAHIFRKTPKTISNWIKNGKLQSERDGRRVLVVLSDDLTTLEKRTKELSDLVRIYLQKDYISNFQEEESTGDGYIVHNFNFYFRGTITRFYEEIRVEVQQYESVTTARIRFVMPFFIQFPTDEKSSLAMLQRLMYLNHQIRYIKFGWDQEDTEVRLELDIPLIDNDKLTFEQFKHCHDTISGVANQHFAGLVKLLPESDE
jgi:hypothetical protein